MLSRFLLLALLLTPAAASAQFQPGRIPASSRDSFDVVYQGQPVGAFILSHAKTGDNITLVADIRLAQIGLTELDSMVFNATTFAPVLLTNNQSMGGMTFGGRVTVANGQATGSAQQPGPVGVSTMPIDVAVGAGIIADGAEALLIPTIDFSEALTVNFSTFDGKQGKVKPYVLKVAGKESVTVPAGTYEGWKCEITGDNELVLIWVSTAEPRKVLMLRLDAQQVEMKRASK